MIDLDRLWPLPKADLALPAGEVHIWRAALNLAPPQVHSLCTLLSADEVRRADRLVSERARTHFTVARGLLRLLLSRYLHIDPRALHFHYNPYGKPALAPSVDHAHVVFNVSHAHELALFAIASSGALGVDIEYIRPIPEVEHIAQQFFAAQEQSALRALPDDQRLRAFFACWTRKEAYIKARGEGLSLRLDQFYVSVAPDAPAKLLAVASDEREHTRWTLRALEPGPGYVAALAIEGQGWTSHCWRWPSSEEQTV